MFEFFAKHRMALPLGAFLLFLNMASALLGGISAKTFLCALSVLVLTQITYAYDARFKSREDEINRPQGGGALSGRYLLAAAVIPLAVMLLAGLWAPLVYAAVVTFLYSDPGIFPRRLKTIPGVKMLVMMSSFWVAGVLTPALLKYEMSGGLVLSLLRSTVPLLVFLFCLTVLLDIRDVAGDREAGVRTLPVIIGVPASAGLLVLLLAAGGAAAFAGGYTGGALLAFALAVFTVLAVKPRGRLYYEAGLAAINVFLAARLVYVLLK